MHIYATLLVPFGMQKETFVIALQPINASRKLNFVYISKIAVHARFDILTTLNSFRGREIGCRSGHFQFLKIFSPPVAPEAAATAAEWPALCHYATFIGYM